MISPNVTMSSTAGGYRRVPPRAPDGHGGAWGSRLGAMTTMALLGTGTMGTGMARRIAGAGLDLRVWNR